jgi:hypothetical protein
MPRSVPVQTSGSRGFLDQGSSDSAACASISPKPSIGEKPFPS